MNWVAFGFVLSCVMEVINMGILKIKCLPGSTDKICLVNQDNVEISKAIEASMLDDSGESDRMSYTMGAECATGTKWMNRCNECQCDVRGYADCSQIECTGYDFETNKRCASGSIWRNDCNLCWCKDGQPYCLQADCRASMNPFVSDYGETAGDLQRRQTERFSDEKLRRMACIPKQTFKNRCNVFCLCSEDGFSFRCATNECVDVLDLNSELIEEVNSNELPDTDKHTKVCQPNSVFYSSCNICVCNDSGSDYACSNQLCSKSTSDEISNEIMKPSIRVFRTADSHDYDFD